MRSKAQYTLDEYNRSIIQAEFHFTDDARDLIATKFKEAFSGYSGLAIVRFFKESDTGPQKANILPMPQLYPKATKLHFHHEPSDYLCQIPLEQMQDLMVLFTEEIARRKEESIRLQKLEEGLKGE